MTYWLFVVGIVGVMEQQDYDLSSETQSPVQGHSHL